MPLFILLILLLLIVTDLTVDRLEQSLQVINMPTWHRMYNYYRV